MREHLATSNARLPQPEIVIADDATTNQSRELDRLREEARQREREREEARAAPTATLRIRIQDAWLNVEVDLASLRAALSLPNHEIFTRGIYHGYHHPQPEGDDLDDVDHGDNY